jgi:hypothetical protein
MLFPIAHLPNACIGTLPVLADPRQVARRAGPHLRRSDEPGVEPETPRLYPVLWQRGPGSRARQRLHKPKGAHVECAFLASLLIMPLVFFMAPNVPRMLSTLAAILENPSHGGLVSDSLVYRYPRRPALTDFPAGERIPEKLDQARLLFERMLGYANHLGLYAEQTGPQGEALGNFPQAFTHLALISAAFNLDRILGIH